MGHILRIASVKELPSSMTIRILSSTPAMPGVGKIKVLDSSCQSIPRVIGYNKSGSSAHYLLGWSPDPNSLPICRDPSLTPAMVVDLPLFLLLEIPLDSFFGLALGFFCFCWRGPDLLRCLDRCWLTRVEVFLRCSWDWLRLVHSSFGFVAVGTGGHICSGILYVPMSLPLDLDLLTRSTCLLYGSLHSGSRGSFAPSVLEDFVGLCVLLVSGKEETFLVEPWIPESRCWVGGEPKFSYSLNLLFVQGRSCYVHHLHWRI